MNVRRIAPGLAPSQPDKVVARQPHPQPLPARHEAIFVDRRLAERAPCTRHGVRVRVLGVTIGVRVADGAMRVHRVQVVIHMHVAPVNPVNPVAVAAVAVLVGVRVEMMVMMTVSIFVSVLVRVRVWMLVLEVVLVLVLEFVLEVILVIRVRVLRPIVVMREGSGRECVGGGGRSRR